LQLADNINTDKLHDEIEKAWNAFACPNDSTQLPAQPAFNSGAMGKSSVRL